MSKTLEGMHYCKEHQGNGSDYATENCHMCSLLAKAQAHIANTQAFMEGVISTEAKDAANARRDMFAAAALMGLSTDRDLSWDYAARIAIWLADRTIAALDRTAE